MVLKNRWYHDRNRKRSEALRPARMSVFSRKIREMNEMKQSTCTKKANAELMKETVHLSFREEAGNAISHGLMMALYLLSLPFLSVYGYLRRGWIGTAGLGIYMICMICMFGGSCLYHVMPYDTPWKTIFRKLDHISILLAIAGTYTPICLIALPGWTGYTLLGIEWGLALAGILLKSLSNYAHPNLSMALYLAMGWMAVFVLPAVWHAGGPLFVALIAGGGICYTVGAYFYSRRKPNDHFIWHLLIAAAALMHLAAIVLCLY